MEQHETIKMIEQLSAVIIAPQELKVKLESGRKLCIKLGADPSRPDLHLGHSVVLRALRIFQDLGHEVIFVIGDFTGMIGDPTGKSKTRIPLTFEQTRKNGKSYYEQVVKILDPHKTRIEYNSQWLAAMRFEEILQLASQYTLARVMERDDFAKRWVQQQSIGLHELLYPLMQGYDSVVLQADIEVGGTDQTFNLLVGRELQRGYGQEPQVVITFPLLPGLDGVEKMSKSLDNYIGITEPADIMFEKCMKVPDTLLVDYFRLTCSIAPPVYQRAIADDIWQAHRLYAREIVRMYHGEDASQRAMERYDQVAGGQLPDQMDTRMLPAGNIGIVELLRKAGLAQSNGEARRLIAGGGIKINHRRVDDDQLMIMNVQELVISRGKNRFVRIRFDG